MLYLSLLHHQSDGERDGGRERDTHTQSTRAKAEKRESGEGEGGVY